MWEASKLAAIVTVAAASAALAGVVVASPLDDDCSLLDRTPGTSCRFDRSDREEWLLRTGYQVGTGRLAGIEQIEGRFCDAVRRAGVSGHVHRASEIAGAVGQGAIVEYECGPPAVSAAPRAH